MHLDGRQSLFIIIIRQSENCEWLLLTANLDQIIFGFLSVDGSAPFIARIKSWLRNSHLVKHWKWWMKWTPFIYASIASWIKLSTPFTTFCPLFRWHSYLFFSFSYSMANGVNSSMVQKMILFNVPRHRIGVHCSHSHTHTKAHTQQNTWEWPYYKKLCVKLQ